jgi:hypothetical protein
MLIFCTRRSVRVICLLVPLAARIGFAGFTMSVVSLVKQEVCRIEFSAL